MELKLTKFEVARLNCNEINTSQYLGGRHWPCICPDGDWQFTRATLLFQVVKRASL